MFKKWSIPWIRSHRHNQQTPLRISSIWWWYEYIIVFVFILFFVCLFCLFFVLFCFVLFALHANSVTMLQLYVAYVSSDFESLYKRKVWVTYLDLQYKTPMYLKFSIVNHLLNPLVPGDVIWLTCSAPNHYLIQSWFPIRQSIRNKPQ